MELTQEKLKELFEYNPGGYFVRKANTDPSGRGKAQVGTIVKGSAHDARGYIKTSILGKKYYLHRLIWLYHYGTLPTYIDHINNIPSDNRLENLREATFCENKQNTKTSKVNTSGIKGLYYCPNTNRWVASIHAFGVNYRKNFPGAGDNVKAIAVKWLQDKRTELHGEFANHG